MTTGADQDRLHRTVEAVWRMESGKLVAGLARVTGDVGLAEELAQDALVVALEQWPRSSIPPNPAAWLMTTAKNRGLDVLRRRGVYQRKLQAVARDTGDAEADIGDTVSEELDDHVGDDLLRLIFTSCHPALSVDSRVALTLRCLGGLTTAEIGRAFLVPEATAGQRISRAKKTLRDAGVAFALPTPAELQERLAAVLEIVYLIFNEGYAATAGEDWVRPGLCHEALRLGRVLAGLMPGEPEVHGLVALMELQASRLPARTGPDGAPVLLADQDRRRWDRLLIRRGLAALERGEALDPPPGPYLLQAAIAACHARALRFEDTDWARIAALYDVLARVWPSPVVELNRAVAVGMALGPAAGLAELDARIPAGALDGYAQLPAARGDLLARLGRAEEAAAAFRHAAELSRNQRERDLFLQRAETGG